MAINMNKKQKSIIIFIAAILVIDIILGIFLFLQRTKSSLNLEASNINISEHLYSINSMAKKALISSDGYAKFNFTDSQKTAIQDIFWQNNNAALILRLEVCPTSKQIKRLTEDKSLSLSFGLFTSDNINDCILVKADEKELLQNKDRIIVDISLAFPKKQDGSLALPEGFFVYSNLRCKIKSAYASEAIIGFDNSTEIPFYGFAPNGGKIEKDFTPFDFSGCALVFPTQNTNNKIMPEYVIKLSNNPDYLSNIKSSVLVELNIAGEKFNIKNVKNATDIIIPTSSVNNPFSKIDLSTNKICCNGILMRNYSGKKLPDRTYEESSTEVFRPIKTDPGLILKWNQNNWRTLDYELFEWDRFDNILIFDTRNYTIQDNFFRRLAFFTEKEGYKGNLLLNEELGDMHGFNALDYRPESLAAFFNQAIKTGFKLNKEEITLLKICLANGILIQNKDQILPGKGGIVSISRESSTALREQLFSHEICHMFFFIDEDFRNFVAAIYGTMDPNSLQFLIDYFTAQKHLGYDTNDEYLMHNEFMAYLLQQDISEVAPWFTTHCKIDAVLQYTPTLCEYIIQTNARGFEDAALALNDYVFDHYGVLGGCVQLVFRK